MPLIGSSKNYTTYQEFLDEDNFPIGVDGDGNRIVGPYGSDSSVQVGAPISGGIGDGAFAPMFNLYSPGAGGNGVARDEGAINAARQAYLGTQTDGYNVSEGEFLNWWSNSLGSENPANYSSELAYLQALAPTNAQAREILSRSGNPLTPAPAAPAPSSPVTNTAANITGAVQGSGIVAQQVSAPVASGADSVAQQITGPAIASGGDVVGSVQVSAPVSGPVIQGDIVAPVVAISAPVSAPVTTIGGDNLAPIIAPTGPVNAPITAVQGDVVAPIVNATAGAGGISAPIAATGDIEISAPVVTAGGNVQITTADPFVAQAAIQASQDNLASSLAFAGRALDVVADSKRDPSEKTANTALWVSLGFGLLAALAS